MFMGLRLIYGGGNVVLKGGRKADYRIQWDFAGSCRKYQDLKGMEAQNLS
jgi:hypothetical protein